MKIQLGEMPNFVLEPEDMTTEVNKNNYPFFYFVKNYPPPLCQYLKGINSSRFRFFLNTNPEFF